MRSDELSNAVRVNILIQFEELNKEGDQKKKRLTLKKKYKIASKTSA